VAATAQFSWPPAFSSLAVSVQVLMAADTILTDRGNLLAVTTKSAVTYV